MHDRLLVDTETLRMILEISQAQMRNMLLETREKVIFLINDKELG